MPWLKKVTPYLPPILTEILGKFSRPRANGKTKAKKSRVTPKAPAPASSRRSPVISPVLRPWQWAALAASFALAGIGQYFWAQSSVPKTLPIGFIPFLAAVILFLLALRPWKREGLAQVPLSPAVEWTAFGLILGIAAFFRLYRLGEIPNGMFMDQGNEGLMALKILHEKFRPFFEIPEFENPALLLYSLAAWFVAFPATQFGFYLFFAVMGLATIPLAYWTLRQLTGPRVALLSMFIFAVMRWHFNFCRNGFPTVQVPFYMFGTLAFLLFGLRSNRRWPFVVSSLFFSAGLYTYNSFKLFPLLLIVLAAYEFFADRTRFLKNLRSILVFASISLVLASPLLYRWTTHGIGSREASNSLLSDVKGQHSLKPVWTMVKKTAFMFNREGDDNERHNLANHRMLDDVSASLFVVGLFYAISRARRRKYFYALAGIAVMSLPCLLSVVPAHANRMLGITVFACFLIATPLAAVWGRVRALWGAWGEVFFLLLLVEPLLLMGYQNYKVYFVDQAKVNSYWEASFWGAYSIDASQVGKALAKDGDTYDFVMFPRLATHPTVNYLGYRHRDHLRTLKLPEGLTPLQTPPDRGLCFALLSEHEGYLRTLEALYPHGQRQDFKDLNDHVYLYLYRVPPADVAAAKGLQGEFAPGGKRTVTGFPADLPQGPFHAVLRGSLLVPASGTYRLDCQSNAQVSTRLGGQPAEREMRLERGYYPVEMNLVAAPGPVRLKTSLVSAKGVVTNLPDASWTALRIGGLEATYYPVNGWKGEPALVQWDPMVNFVNGTDFPYTNWQMSVRWEGTLEAPTSGEYFFSANTDEKVGLTIDGKTVIPWAHIPRSGKIVLAKGPHRLRLDFEKILGPTLSLLWKTPGAVALSPVPNTAFGVPHADR